jgi:hypothetical protein
MWVLIEETYMPEFQSVVRAVTDNAAIAAAWEALEPDGDRYLALAMELNDFSDLKYGRRSKTGKALHTLVLESNATIANAELEAAKSILKRNRENACGVCDGTGFEQVIRTCSHCGGLGINPK